MRIAQARLGASLQAKDLVAERSDREMQLALRDEQTISSQYGRNAAA